MTREMEDLKAAVRTNPEGTDLERLRALAEKATPGPRKHEYLGGASTVLVGTRPPRNDTRIPAYAYDETRGHCIAYPTILDMADGNVDYRYDYVCFSHADAAYIAACDPSTIIALITRCLAAEKERDEAKQSAADEYEVAQHYLQHCYVDPGANNRVTWKARAEKAERRAADNHEVCAKLIVQEVEKREAAESALAQAIAERDRALQHLRSQPCLAPINGLTVGECVLKGECGCDNAAFLLSASQALTTTTGRVDNEP